MMVVSSQFVGQGADAEEQTSPLTSNRERGCCLATNTPAVVSLPYSYMTRCDWCRHHIYDMGLQVMNLIIWSLSAGVLIAYRMCKRQQCGTYRNMEFNRCCLFS